jgi:hypothetical protein
VSGKKKDMARHIRAEAQSAINASRRKRKNGKREKKECGTSTSLPYSCSRRPIRGRLPTPATSSTYGGIRALYPDDANEAWCGYTHPWETNMHLLLRQPVAGNGRSVAAGHVNKV